MQENLENDFKSQNSEIFARVAHNFGRSDNYMIYWKNAYFK